ncbi:MAG: TIGR03032 family protein [Pirellulales bacterium]
MSSIHASNFSPDDIANQTAVRYEHSPDFPSILEYLQASLIITTYQAGQVVVVGVEKGNLQFSFHAFNQPMGVAVGREQIAIGTRREIQILRAAQDIAKRIEPAGTYDSAWLARSQWITGATQVHEMAWTENGFCFVNTLFSCLCTIDNQHSFVPIWKPPFVSELEPNDRCHMNGLALRDGKPAFVTCHGTSNAPGGWRENKSKGGVIVSIETGEIVADGLAMPHSPRWAHDRLWVLHSGAGMLCSVDEGTGQVQAIERFPGYVRGLDFYGQFAFVGLSKIRERSVFGNLPIEQDRANLRCGVGVFDLVSGRSVASLQFHSGVDEIFAVSVIPSSKRPYFAGPSEQDSQREIWLLPESVRAPGQVQPEARVSADQPPEQIAASISASAVQMHQQGRLKESLALFQQSLEIIPNQAMTLCNLGNLWQDLEDQHSALECYKQAVSIDETCVPALQNLGYLYCAQCQPELAVQVYQKLIKCQSSPLNHVLDAGILPVVYSSTDELKSWRARFTGKLRSMVSQSQVIDTEKTLVPTSFFLAYQGEKNVEVMKDFGRIYRGPQLCERAAEPLKPRADGKLRVGFVSAYFRDHTIGRLNLGRIQHLDRSRFEVTVISTTNRTDSVVAQFRKAADRFVTVDRNPHTAREKIADQDLDILVFADVGMDALASTLVWSRMAPVQCATWGHPETTGSSHIDFFLSSKLLEMEEGQRNYTEHLVKFDRLATYFELPQVEFSQPQDRKSRRDLGRSFGFETSLNYYVCPQTLYKVHPDYDSYIKGVLQSDPQAKFVLIEGREQNWTNRLRTRLESSLGTDLAGRVEWLKPQPRIDYLRLLAASDVILDPIHFGGGHSSYEALAMSAPVVTLPGDLLRNRITLALYRLMGMDQLIVASPSQYVSLAVSIANDETFRRSLSESIYQCRNRIFENRQEVDEFSDWLWSLTTPEAKVLFGQRP